MADVHVYDNCSDQVQCNLDGLQTNEGLWELLRVLHLADERQEGHVSGESKNDVKRAGKRGLESGVDCRLDRGSGLFYSSSNHGDEDRSNNGDESHDREVGDILQRPWQGQEKEDHKTNNAPDDSACGVACNGVHRNGKGQEMASQDKYLAKY